MPKFCPTCGNSSDKIRFYGNFCEDCAKKKNSENLVPSVEITRCKRCGRIRSRGAFVPPNGRNLEAAISQSMKGHDIHLIDFTENTATIDVTKQSEAAAATVEHKLNIVYRKTLCEVCFKKAANYHEAVMQLRGNSTRVEKMVEKLTRYFESNNEFISKVEYVENGIDLYLSSKALANSFVLHMRLKPQKSYTLAGVKNGKQVYKNTYSLKL